MASSASLLLGGLDDGVKEPFNTTSLQQRGRERPKLSKGESVIVIKAIYKPSAIQSDTPNLQDGARSRALSLTCRVLVGALG